MANCKGFKMAFAPLSHCRVMVTGMILVSILTGEGVLAQERSQCFMVAVNGELLDLSSVCSPPPGIGSQKKTELPPQATPTSSPPPDATQEPPTNETDNKPTEKASTNRNIRYGSSSSGTTQANDTRTTRRMSGKDKRQAQRVTKKRSENE